APDRRASPWTGRRRRPGGARLSRPAARSGPRGRREAGSRAAFPPVGAGRQRRYHGVVFAGLAGLGGAARGPEVFEEVDVDLVVFLPLVRYVVFVVDRLDRADRFARAAVHALVGVDVEHALALVDAVDGAFFDARSVKHINAGLRDDVGHV